MSIDHFTFLQLCAVRRFALIAILASLSVCASAYASSPEAAKGVPEREIVVDCHASDGATSRVYKHCVGAGRANEGLRADWQRQLSHAKSVCDFQYIRMHGLLTDDMGVYQETRDGKPVYNWQYIDELYDFLERTHVRPFVELGFMPSALASGGKSIFWWRGNVTPPKDYEKWGNLIKALTEHWTQRYGKEEVKTWYFEVWNEPNLDGFWGGDQKEYFKLYTASANAIKEVCPDYRVGGPATAGSAWVPEFIDYCVKTNSPVDFITTHTYGVDQGFLDEMGGRGTVLSHSPDSIIGDVKRVSKEIKDSALPNLPLYFTEWSSSYTPADAIHDSYIEAPYVLDKLKRSVGASSMSYWTFTDIFEEAGPRMTPFHGGFGMINYQDIEKPVFHAYQYLNRLGDTKLASHDDRSILAKDAHGGVQALFWDLTNNQPADINNQVYYLKDLKPEHASDAKLVIKNLAPGRYTVSVYRVGYRVNDPYDEYRDMGSPSQLTRAQVAHLREHSSGKAVSVETVSVREGEALTRRYPVRENDVYLVCVDKR